MKKRSRLIQAEEALPEGLEVLDPAWAAMMREMTRTSGGATDEPSKLEQAVLAGMETARIRRDPKRQVRWLLEFEAVKIGRLGYRASLRLREQARDRFVPGFSTPGRRDLEDVQRNLIEGLGALRSDKPWVFEFSDKPKAILLPPPRGRAVAGDGGAQMIWGPTRLFLERFLLSAMRELDRVGDRLRLCRKPGCSALFLANKRQEICNGHAAEVQRARLVEVTRRRLEERHRIREAKARRRALRRSP